MKKLYIILLASFAISLSACGMPNISQNNNDKQVNSEEWTVKNKKEDNKQVNSEKEKIEKNKEIKKEWISNWNKYIWFVSTWCPHCQKAVPDMEKFATDTNWQIEINVVNKKAFPGVKNLKQNYTNPKSYKDYTNEECGYIPSYVIVDANWKVIDKKCWGSLDYGQLKSRLLQSWNKNQEQQSLNNKNEIMTDKVVKNGDIIAVDYIGKFTDGKVFDTSIEEEAKKANLYNTARTYKPLEFTVWAGQMIPCFDKGVEGMKIGETKEIKCEPKDAYGECDESRVIKVEKAKLKDFEQHWYKLEKWVELPTQHGMLKIADVKDGIVYLDTNSPMCGKKLIFTVTLKEIK